jgi:hypothetical protein
MMKDTDNSEIFQIMKNEKSDADVFFCAWSGEIWLWGEERGML